MLGIGASSSAAYTLRKHYTKNLLAYECQFDRGGIDPQPIINQVEASSKKKGSKAVSVPSPGSSNSQDSFPAPGSGSASMDGYGSYSYQPGGNQDFNGPSQRPSSQTNAPSPHGGTAACCYLSHFCWQRILFCDTEVPFCVELVFMYLLTSFPTVEYQFVFGVWDSFMLYLNIISNR